MLGTASGVAHLKRKDGRVIVHFDYDCFYAAVFENENPALKSLPLGVQQKQIIVTCNYEARRRGLHKLQLITEAKRVCPDAVIVLGEDLTRFRDASKLLYSFIRSFTWSDKAERLGFDEVWLDVTDICEYNRDVLNKNDLSNSFFQLSRDDPTLGFSFDASSFAGCVYPADGDTTTATCSNPAEVDLRLRLLLGSHLAFHIRQEMDSRYGYTCTVGIAPNKLMSKLVGNMNKPKGQTTLLPPYEPDDNGESNVLAFLDAHDIGKIPGIGFKIAQKLREHYLQRKSGFDAGLVYGGTKEMVNVADIRHMPDLSAKLFDKILAGPGTAHGIGLKILGLIHGIDPTEVSQARNVPRQISIEDSYLRLDSMKELLEQLQSLSARLIERMRIDLTEPLDEPRSGEKWKWLSRPPQLRLTTRPRLPLNDDGSRQRSFKRISRSTATPTFIFSQTEAVEALADRLVKETLLSLFRKLHPEKSGWNLSLVNVAVTGMTDEGKGGAGKDISSMFKRAEEVKVEREDPHSVQNRVEKTPLPSLDDDVNGGVMIEHGEESMRFEDDGWDEDEDAGELDDRCPLCGSSVPTFAKAAHERFHGMEP